MIKTEKILFALILIFSSMQSVWLVQAKESDKRSESKKVRYKAGKTVDFEKLLIRGELKRPDISVVTGNTSESIDGLLKLRENFLDKMAVASGEEIK